MVREELVSECQRRANDGAHSDAVLDFLRLSGCSQIESIAIAMAVYGVNLAKAKELVHFSTTWSDTQVANDEFHDALVDAVKGKDLG